MDSEHGWQPDTTGEDAAGPELHTISGRCSPTRCPSQPGPVGQLCPAPAREGVFGRVGGERVPCFGCREMVSGGGVRRVCDVRGV